MKKIQYFLTTCILAIAISQKYCSAQVIPDNTLGSEISEVQSIDELRNLIEGGAVRDGNLFHSFSEFSVDEGTRVDFSNPAGVINIFSRVTGKNLSEIFGELGVNGAANLFFMNPNGIIFGENTVINVNGSFLATTAETINFENGNEFSAVNPDDVLLSIDFPIGLGFDSNSKQIRVQGSGNQLESAENFNSPVTNPEEFENGINIFSNETLALIGNQITLDGGVLSAPSGLLEIASIESGIVGINLSSNKLQFDYSKVSEFQDIVLNNRSLLDTSGSPGGTIRVRGQDIFLGINSVILNSNFGTEDSGNININASGKIDLKGIDSLESFSDATSPGIVSQSLGSGKGANVIISANDITFSDFSLINSTVFNSGNGGDVNIDVNNTITIAGASLIEDVSAPIVSSITTTSLSSGNAGNIKLSGKNLFITQGGVVLSRSFSGGKGGDIEADFKNVDLSNFFILDASQDDFLGSTIGSNTNFGIGGNVTINTAKLSILDGGRINATTSGAGKAGNINIEATESIIVQGGTSDSGDNSFANASQITAAGEIPESSLRQIFNLPELPTGESGNVILKTKQLSVENEGTINVLNQGLGNAGNIEINAEQIELKNEGIISASTASGQGGNIALRSDDLKISDLGQITASADGSGNGGNVNIDSSSVLGINNSDITANAVGGSGGNITINSDAILGLEERSQLTPFGDITATSEFGIDGTINVNSPDNNAERDVFSAFRNYASPKTRTLVKSRCLNPRNSKGKLLYVGRSGIPENPNKFFDDDEIAIVDRVIQPKQSSQNPDQSQVWVEGDPIIDSNSIKIGKDGEIFLVAETNLENASSSICSNEN